MVAASTCVMGAESTVCAWAVGEDVTDRQGLGQRERVREGEQATTLTGWTATQREEGGASARGRGDRHRQGGTTRQRQRGSGRARGELGLMGRKAELRKVAGCFAVFF